MENNNEGTHQLWVQLSGLADGNIFAIYPKILEEIFLQEEQNREEEHRNEIESIVLPSDMEWRLKVYFQLVEKQRELDDVQDAEATAMEKLKTNRRWSRPDSENDSWGPLIAGVSTIIGNVARTAAIRETKALNLRDPPWGPRDLAKAARLLEKPPMHVTFDDDQEMRRVYFLIYDVFRYKIVLEEALNDAGFYTAFSQAENRKSLAWLLLLDQQRRKWAKRDIAKDLTEDSSKKNSRERSRSRRKLSKDSARMSRDSSSESRKGSRLSRESSLDRREGRFYRYAAIKTKVRAVKELSVDTKEALRLAREVASAKKMQESNHIGDVEQKQTDVVQEVIVNQEEQQEDVIKEEVDQPMEIGETPDSMKSETSRSTSEMLEYTISRGEMRRMMEVAAGEVGPVINQFDTALWDNKVRIAAALAKIRIRNKALTLSELLPPHLRDERVSASLHREVVTGWVNVFKSRSISELVQRLNEMGYSYSTSKQLGPNQFKFDRVCPKFISLRPAVRSEFIRSSLLSEYIIVLQEREFCLGAAALCRALRAAQLHGDVVQTHGTSPRAAGYLASQLRDLNTEQGHLLVFGAGDRKSEYEGFLKAMGATNTKVFSENVRDVASGLWSTVVAALAAPPNSYSAVADPIDLVCSRGGDLGMLEVLTESEVSIDGRNRVMKILEEQKKTLRYCMSKPQIQMIMYETHSALSAENEDMIKRAISEANRAARELHAIRRQKARETLPKPPKCASQTQGIDGEEIKDDENVEDEILVEVEEYKDVDEENVQKITEELDEDEFKVDTLQLPVQSAQESTTATTPVDPDTEFINISVPDCDMFEEQTPSPLARLSQQDRDGCFLALIQRKEMIKMNAKYMINVAEARGLFGGNAPVQKRPQTKKKMESEEKTTQIKRKLTKLEGIGCGFECLRMTAHWITNWKFDFDVICRIDPQNIKLFRLMDSQSVVRFDFY